MDPVLEAFTKVTTELEKLPDDESRLRVMAAAIVMLGDYERAIALCGRLREMKVENDFKAKPIETKKARRKRRG